MEQVEQRLGNYRLIQPLGNGAFTDVYLGEHFYLNTLVAIKVLRSRLVHVMLTWMDLAIQRMARHAIGPLTVWKHLLPNRTQYSLLTHSCERRGTDDQPTVVKQSGCHYSTEAPSGA